MARIYDFDKLGCLLYINNHIVFIIRSLQNLKFCASFMVCQTSRGILLC